MTTQRIALVTGANKGLGREVARQLGARGAEVIVGARDLERGRQAVDALTRDGIRARAVALDVTSQASIDRAATLLESELGRLDILVNNAGIFIDGTAPTSQLELAPLRTTFETNFFGAFAVTKAMLPLLRRSSAGRIVNMSSGLGSLTLSSDPSYEFAQFKALAYNASKAALNMLTIHLAYELAGTPIKVNSVTPGHVATDLTGHRAPRTVVEGAAIAVKLALAGDDAPSGQFFDDDGTVPW